MREHSHEIFAVVADVQNKGRGTQGRNWITGKGNLFMTLGFPLSKVPIPLTLVPLR
jgi:biotin-(acetyl-CoA carboxylase) ligase